MKKRFQLAALILLFTVYCVYLNRYSFLVASSPLRLDSPDRYYDYKGITHAHSILSTGSGSPSEIISTAQSLEMDFVIFTEVNLLEHDKPLEGYFNSVLALEGGEYSYLDSRLLYYDHPRNQPPSATGQAQVFFADQLSQHPRSKENGFLVLAHPFHSRYEWTGDFPVGLDGIEIVNLKSVLDYAWREKTFASIFSIITYPFNPSAALVRVFRDPLREQELWDKMSQTRKTLGFLGTDATAKAILAPGFFIKFPSYATAFGVSSNHILMRSELTGNFEGDKRKVWDALREGQFYISLDILGNPKGFWAEIKSGDKNFPMGSEMKLNKDMSLLVHLPSVPRVHYEVRILRNGDLYASSQAQDTDLHISMPGVYRIVVRVLVPLPFPEGDRWVPWIYSNPFFIRS